MTVYNVYFFLPPILFSFLKFCSASYVIVLVEVGEDCSRDDAIAVSTHRILLQLRNVQILIL